MEFLIPKEQLKGLSEEEQKAVKDEALSQFLLGSIFGGQGIASGYQAVQNIIPNMQKQKQQQGLLQELTGIQQEFFPTAAQAGQRALGAEGKGPTLTAAQNQQAILNQPIDFNAAYSRIGRLATNPNATQMLPGLTTALEKLQPKVQGDLVLNANQQVLRGLPTQKEGITSQYNPLTGGFSAAPVQNYMQSRIQTTPPEVSTNTMLVPVQGGGFVQQAIPGATTAVGAIEGAKAVGQAAGQVEQVIDPVTQQKKFVPRSSLLGGGQPTVGGFGVGGIAEVSPSQKTMNETADARFKTFSKNSQDSSDTAGSRKLAAQQLYDLSTRIDNNKLTGIQAGVYSYMNAIPGIGKLFEQDITDVTRMNQAIATAQLEKTAQQKGAASNLDAQVIAKGYATLTDPASATRMLAAQEEALADKDLARQRFIESYAGDPGKITSAWEKAPENQPIFNHPKFNQFLTEQVNKWQQGGSQGAPVMPAGFTVGRSKSTGAILIKKPDGSLFTVGQ